MKKLLKIRPTSKIKNCEICEVEFEAHRYRKVARFCSHECANLARRSPRETLTCSVCKKKFKAIIGKRKRKYCSGFCRYNVGPGGHGGGVVVACAVCKRDFRIGKFVYTKDPFREFFCSQVCYHARQLWKIQPNKAEIKLGQIIQPLGFTYVGNGQFPIGSKHPDFVNKKSGLVIDLFGGYWHDKKEEPIRIRYFSKFGYRCLIIWDGELRDLPRVKNKIFSFLKKAA